MPFEMRSQDSFRNRVNGERSTVNGGPRVIATGGLSVVVAPLCTTVDVVDNDLTLHGLKLAARHVGLTW